METLTIDGTCADCGQPISRTDGGNWCHWDTQDRPDHRARVRDRENPATMFIARNMGERITGMAWREMSTDHRARWIAYASDLVIAMYARGFVIPQPQDVDAIWDELSG